jgi:hypothetical protein
MYQQQHLLSSPRDWILGGGGVHTPSRFSTVYNISNIVFASTYVTTPSLLVSEKEKVTRYMTIFI